jgi:putative flippase GtrA
VNTAVRGNPVAFVAVGGIAAAVHLTTVFILVEYGAMPPPFANVIAFLCAFSVSFAGHSRHSFRSGKKTPRSWWRWLQVSITAFFLNQGLYLMALHAFPHTGYLLLLGIVTGVVAFFSYALGKLWAFHA